MTKKQLRPLIEDKVQGKGLMVASNYAGYGTPTIQNAKQDISTYFHHKKEKGIKSNKVKSYPTAIISPSVLSCAHRVCMIQTILSTTPDVIRKSRAIGKRKLYRGKEKSKKLFLGAKHTQQSFLHIKYPVARTPRKKKETVKEPSTEETRATLKTIYTSPSYKDSAETIVSSRLLPSLNSSMSRLPFSSLSIMRKIFLTRFSGVSSSSGSLTMEPTIL